MAGVDSALYNGQIAPKEFDEITLSPPSKPTAVVWKQSGKTLREIKLTYEGATENLEKLEILV